MSDYERVTGDVASAAVLAGSLLNWLPAIAAIFTIVWTLLRIMESAVFLHYWQRVFGAPAPWLKGEKRE